MLSPLVALWLPCLLLGLFAAWRYYSTCFTLKRDPFSAAMDSGGEFIANLRHAVMRRLGFESGSS